MRMLPQAQHAPEMWVAAKSFAAPYGNTAQVAAAAAAAQRRQPLSRVLFDHSNLLLTMLTECLMVGTQRDLLPAQHHSAVRREAQRAARSLVKALRESTGGVLPIDFQLLALESLLVCFRLAIVSLPPPAQAGTAPALDALVKRIMRAGPTPLIAVREVRRQLGDVAVVAAAKHADRLGWLLQNAFATSVDLTGADADLALAVGVPALYRTLASLALQSPAEAGSRQASLRQFQHGMSVMRGHLEVCPLLAVGLSVGPGSLLELLMQLGCSKAGCPACVGEEQAPFRLDRHLPERAACAALLRMIGQICSALDAAAANPSSRTASEVLAACTAGPGGEDSPAKWTRLRAELLPAARQQAQQAAARSPLAGISSGALACLALRQAGCNNPGCTNLVGSSERGLQLKLCSSCKVARYCCRECQAEDWRRGHKAVCGEVGRLCAGGLPG